VGIEREDDRRPVHPLGLGQQSLDNPRVPLVNAVEIADGNRAPAQIGRQMLNRSQ
jgi:hypothetical protein